MFPTRFSDWRSPGHYYPMVPQPQLIRNPENHLHRRRPRSFIRFRAHL